MYNMVKSSIIFYKKIMTGTGYRDSLIDPFILLTDVEIYYDEKNRNTLSFGNLSFKYCPV